MSSSDAGGNLGRISLTIGITLANAIIECRASRSTTKLYDPAVTLGDDQIRELVKIATTTPISFNLRNLRFIAVRTPEAKARLRAVAWDQPKVTDAAVTFIICRQLVDHSVLPARLASALEARSEEHTSELQSLMRISYAVFCLKKKNINNNADTTHQVI